MFDTMKIARRIRQARIEKNMTQVNLADAMEVSYQAVSNWERGNSMPDISKLEDLCAVLDISLEELLGTEQTTAEAVSKAMDEKPLSMEELEDIAPILLPEQVKQQTAENAKKRKLKLSALSGLAPFMDDNFWRETIGNVTVEDAKEIASVAPFLPDDVLDSLVSQCESVEDLKSVSGLAPFLSKKTLNSLLGKLEKVDGWSGIMSVAPFLSKETLDDLAKKCLEEVELKQITGLAPFLSKETLDYLSQQLLDKGEWKNLTGLYPFLPRETLRKIAKKLMEEQNLSALGEIMPFV